MTEPLDVKRARAAVEASMQRVRRAAEVAAAAAEAAEKSYRTLEAAWAAALVDTREQLADGSGDPVTAVPHGPHPCRVDPPDSV